jgi:hypothetical protein
MLFVANAKDQHLLIAKHQLGMMKLLSLLSLGAAVAALPAAMELSSRASISKTDGLKFNIDGVTKCKSGKRCTHSQHSHRHQITPEPTPTGFLS